MGPGVVSPGWPKASWVLLYFSAYLGYLWLVQENEFRHWLSLVIVPWLLLWLLTRREEPGLRMRDVARRLGLAWPRANRGMGIALALTVLVQAVQLLNGAQRAQVLQVFSSSRALWIVPAALLFTLMTVGFTEEFFFRGVMQRALSAHFGSHGRGILVTSVLFSLYHVPYAYLAPFWPSSGDLVHAIQLAFTNGLLGGVVLGLLFARTPESLVPCVLVHAAVDWIPAMHLIGQIKVQL